jgi:hypothetical protein
MDNFDLLQEKKIRALFGIVTLIGGITTVLIYVQNRKHKKEATEIAALEKELKLLQIERLKNDKKNGIF